jgi:hypothetical protein
VSMARNVLFAFFLKLPIRKEKVVLNGRPPNTGANCQGDVQGAVDECCLAGFSTLVSTFLPGISR